MLGIKVEISQVQGFPDLLGWGAIAEPPTLYTVPKAVVIVLTGIFPSYSGYIGFLFRIIPPGFYFGRAGIPFTSRLPNHPWIISVVIPNRAISIEEP